MPRVSIAKLLGNDIVYSSFIIYGLLILIYLMLGYEYERKRGSNCR